MIYRSLWSVFGLIGVIFCGMTLVVLITLCELPLTNTLLKILMMAFKMESRACRYV